MSPKDTWSFIEYANRSPKIILYEGMYTAFELPTITRVRKDFPDIKYFTTITQSVSGGKVGMPVDSLTATGYTKPSYYVTCSTAEYPPVGKRYFQLFSCGQNGIFSGILYSGPIKSSLLGARIGYPHIGYVAPILFNPSRKRIYRIENVEGYEPPYIHLDALKPKYYPSHITYDIPVIRKPITEYDKLGHAYCDDYFSFQWLSDIRSRIFVGQMMGAYCERYQQSYPWFIPDFSNSYIRKGQKLRIEFQIHPMTKVVDPTNCTKGKIVIHQLPKTITNPHAVFGSGNYNTLKQYIIYESNITDDAKVIDIEVNGHLSIVSAVGPCKLYPGLINLLPSGY